MAKFHGVIGYVENVEGVPGVFKEEVTERTYYGDVIRDSRRWQSGENLNDDLNVNNEISIVADPFAYQHFHAMRYINWMGANWKITYVEVHYPRLSLTIGGVYNGTTGPKSNPRTKT